MCHPLCVSVSLNSNVLPLFEIAFDPCILSDYEHRHKRELPHRVPGWGARIPDCVAGGIRFTVPEPSERQHFGNQIDAASVLARADFVNALRASHRDHSYHFVVAVWRAKTAMLSVAAAMSPMRHLRRVRTWRWRHCRRSYRYCF